MAVDDRYLANIKECAMELSLRPVMTVMVAVTASVIALTPAATPLQQAIHDPAIELSASAESVIDLSNPLTAVLAPSGLGAESDALLDAGGPHTGSPALDALALSGIDLASIDDKLASIITTTATIAILLGVAVTGLDATPLALLGGAVTSLGTAIADLGGVFTPIGTAVGGLSEVPAGIAELIEATGATITQGIVTPIYDYLIKLVSPDSVPTLPDLTTTMDPSAVLDLGRLVPDLLTVF
ncbi:hypothetical protein [Mycobacterium sp.]|uniref:hypothetical protein n=1 Tax=Mycobacterium sp. TaxID=1785 RepID=UPI00127E8195|nr:hypothetical protein [Mycobacterium sp.]KAA8969160.1 MAG: hypothetical protein F6Q13_04180 [Mycobacterium sp.]